MEKQAPRPKSCVVVIIVVTKANSGTTMYMFTIQLVGPFVDVKFRRKGRGNWFTFGDLSQGGHYRQYIYKCMPRSRREREVVKEGGKNRRELAISEVQRQ